jgi:HEAT repeat protein
MAKLRGVEAKLLRLRELSDEPLSSETIEELRKALGDPSNLVVAEAAALIGAKAVEALAVDLVAAFERLMIEPEEIDKRCRGKIAIVEALNKLEDAHPTVFLSGITHVQDPGWGPESGQDAAGALRAHCALGLARTNHPDRLLFLADLLLDTDKIARTGAASALGGSGSLAAIPSCASRPAWATRNRKSWASAFQLFCRSPLPNPSPSWPSSSVLSARRFRKRPRSPWPSRAARKHSHCF